jgi:hypothetical protein
LLVNLHQRISRSLLYFDNRSVVAIATNPVQHGKMKHVEIDQHFLKKKVESQEIHPMYIRGKDQVADLFAKPLSSLCHWFLKCNLSMVIQHPHSLRGAVRNMSYVVIYKPKRHPSQGTISVILLSLSFSLFSLCSSPRKPRDSTTFTQST